MPAAKKSECSSGQKEVDKTHNLGYAENTIMTCAMQCKDELPCNACTKDSGINGRCRYAGAGTSAFFESSHIHGC
jgi:hypothetical protein